jgi:hypothetical protein
MIYLGDIMRRLLIDRYSGNAPTKYDALPLNWIRLAKDYGVEGTIDKASMQQSEDAWQWHTYESDLADIISQLMGKKWIHMMYHWVDPIGNWQSQAENFLRAIDATNPDAIGFDIEQYRSSWTNVWAVMSKQKIYDASVFVVEFVKARCDKPRAPYSAKWYLEKYCPALVDYFGDDPAWVASYADYGKSKRNVTKKDFLDYVEQVYNMPMPTEGIGILRNPIIRQITSTQVLPICRPYNFDINLILDSVKYDTWLANG